MEIISSKFEMARSAIDCKVTRIMHKTAVKKLLHSSSFEIKGGSHYLEEYSILARGSYNVMSTDELANDYYLVNFKVCMYHVTHAIFNRIQTGMFTLDFEGKSCTLIEINSKKAKELTQSEDGNKHMLRKAPRIKCGQRSVVGKYLKYNKYDPTSGYYLYYENFFSNTEETVLKLVELDNDIHPMRLHKLLSQGGLSAIPTEQVKSVILFNEDDFNPVTPDDRTEGLFMQYVQLKRSSADDKFLMLSVIKAR